LGGDIIIKIDNTTVKNQQDIKKYLSTKKVGDSFNLTIIREGKPLVKHIVLTNFKPNLPIILGNDNKLLNPNPGQFPNSSIPLSPDQNFNDFLNMCSKILDRQICNSLIPNQ
ncbi:MAG: PDZ domain-containing protein, partial [Candidatus Nitrosocosmicus sp.]